MFRQSSKHEKGNESRRICPKAHHERWNRITRQKKKLAWKDERERAEIKAEKKNGKGRWTVRMRAVTCLLTERRKKPQQPPVGAGCQSISCPINMSEQAKQTHKKTLSASESKYGSLHPGWLCSEKCSAEHCGSGVCHFPLSATLNTLMQQRSRTFRWPAAQIYEEQKSEIS